MAQDEHGRIVCKFPLHSGLLDIGDCLDTDSTSLQTRLPPHRPWHTGCCLCDNEPVKNNKWTYNVCLWNQTLFKFVSTFINNCELNHAVSIQMNTTVISFYFIYFQYSVDPINFLSDVFIITCSPFIKCEKLFI